MYLCVGYECAKTLEEITEILEELTNELSGNQNKLSKSRFAEYLSEYIYIYPELNKQERKEFEDKFNSIVGCNIAKDILMMFSEFDDSVALRVVSDPWEYLLDKTYGEYLKRIDK